MVQGNNYSNKPRKIKKKKINVIKTPNVQLLGIETLRSSHVETSRFGTEKGSPTSGINEQMPSYMSPKGGTHASPTCWDVKSDEQLYIFQKEWEKAQPSVEKSKARFANMKPARELPYGMM